MTDSSGAVVWAADYLPFGQADVTIETVENNLRFAGQYFDSETGLHYNYHRYYDPKIGRYLRADPIGLKGGMNLYSYAVQNPNRYSDKSGLFSGADIELTMHFYLGGGTDYDISAHCGSYLNDPSISALNEMIKNKIRLKTKKLAGQLKAGQIYNYNMSGRKFLAIKSIYSFCKGYHNFNVECFAKEEGDCCARSTCVITNSAKDRFEDPIDLHENYGVPMPIANIGGTAFNFGLTCSQTFSTTECK